MTVLVDTFKLVNTLKAQGFTEEQATGIKQVIEDINLEHLVTKGDLKLEVQDLKDELRGLELRVLKWAIPILAGQVAVFIALAKWLG